MNFADSHIVPIRYVEVPRRIHRNFFRRNACGDGRTTISAIEGAARSRNGGDRAGRVHLAYAVVLKIRDVDVPCTIQRDTGWQVQHSRNGWTAVTTEAMLPVPAIVLMFPEASTFRILEFS